MKTEFEKKYVVFTSDEFRDVIDDENEAIELAEEFGGVAKLCYFDDRCPPTMTSGEFIGFVISIGGVNIVSEDEITRFKVSFRGEELDGIFLGDTIKFYSSIDESICRTPENPFRGAKTKYLQRHEANYDFMVKTLGYEDILPDLRYFGCECNRQISIGEKEGDEVVLIINPL